MKMKLFCAAAIIAFLDVVSPARADVIYTYTGNPFSIFSGGYSCPPACNIS